jgi:peptide chain release factor 2
VEGFWDNRDKAERILKDVKYWTNLVESWEKIRQKGKDLIELEKIINPEDKSEVETFENDRKTLEAEYKKAHIELFLSGPHDKNDAIMVIASGTGGVEAQDWAEMLLRMYLRYFEKKGFSFAVTEKQMGGEAGIKKAVIEVKGMLAYGYLKSEHGVHRLVRLSPFNAKNLRQTSFALVEVLPVLAEDEGVVIDPKDLRVDTFRSSGPGGQNVNKTESAVRFTHLPTGIVVACQTERSQIQNRIQGIAILKAKLLHKMMEEKAAKVEELKGGYKEAAFGNQIRSYTFQPYTLVKDHRTDAETSQVHQVMDGDLNLFIEAYLFETTKPKA